MCLEASWEDLTKEGLNRNSAGGAVFGLVSGWDEFVIWLAIGRETFANMVNGCNKRDG